MRKISFIVFSALFAIAGCRDKPKEVPKAALLESAHLASEAAFAVQVREYARAEGLLAKAVEINSEDAELWMQLGVARRRLDNRDGARQAYGKALSLREAAYKREPKPELLVQQIEALVLLGKTDEARALLEKAQKKHGNDPQIKEFVAGKYIDQMLADPQFAQLKL